MVRIEFLPNDYGSEPSTDNINNEHLPSSTFPFTKNSLNDDNYTIVVLAQDCAAAHIQAIWRGVRCRKWKYDKCRKVNSFSESQHERKMSHGAALIIQKEWRRYGGAKKSIIERTDNLNYIPMRAKMKNVSQLLGCKV